MHARGLRREGRALVDAFVAGAKAGEDLVADGAGGGGEVVDCLAGVEDGERLGDLGRVGDVDGDQVHGDAADERAGGGAGEEPHRAAAERPVQPVGIAGGDGGDARGTRGGPGGAVADGLAGRAARGPG